MTLSPSTRVTCMPWHSQSPMCSEKVPPTSPHLASQSLTAKCNENGNRAKQEEERGSVVTCCISYPRPVPMLAERTGWRDVIQKGARTMVETYNTLAGKQRLLAPQHV